MVVQALVAYNSQVQAALAAPFEVVQEIAQAGPYAGLDHGVGHPLLLLYDVKAPNDQKSKKFNGLGHDLSNTSLSTF